MVVGPARHLTQDASLRWWWWWWCQARIDYQAVVDKYDETMGGLQQEIDSINESYRAEQARLAELKLYIARVERNAMIAEQEEEELEVKRRAAEALMFTVCV